MKGGTFDLARMTRAEHNTKCSNIRSWQLSPPTIEGHEHWFGATQVPPLAHGGLHIAGRRDFNKNNVHIDLLVKKNIFQKVTFSTYGSRSWCQCSPDSRWTRFHKLIYVCIHSSNCKMCVNS